MKLTNSIDQELAREEREDRDRDLHLGVTLDLAIETIDAAWEILAAEIQRFGYPADKPVPDNKTRYCYFHTMKSDALELADSIYWSLQDDEKAKDDREIEVYEASLCLPENCSRRIEALALLTAADLLISLKVDPLT